MADWYRASYHQALKIEKLVLIAWLLLLIAGARYLMQPVETMVIGV